MANALGNIDFGKQVGPLPLGAWVAVVGTGLGIAYYTRHESAPSAVAVDDSASPSVIDVGGVPGVGTGAVGGWLPTTPAPVSSAPVIASNEEWGVAAINYLIAFGTDAAIADASIRKYLAGSTLNLQETALVRLALTKLGSPPVPLPPPTGNIPTIPKLPPTKPPTPPTKPPPPKPKPVYHYATVQHWPSKLSTLSGIAAQYHTTWQSIYNANRAGKVRPDGKKGMIVNSNKLTPGWVLLIP
jgi:hypothetical protein